MINKNSYFKVYVDENGMITDVEWAEGCKKVLTGELKINPIKDVTINNIQSLEIITGIDKKGNPFKACHKAPCVYYRCYVG